MEENKLAILVLLLALVAFSPSNSKERYEPIEQVIKEQTDSLQYYKQRTFETWELMQIRLKQNKINRHE